MKKQKPPAPQNPNDHFQQMLLEKKQTVLAGLGVKFDTLAAMGRIPEEDQAQLSHDEFVSMQLNTLDYVQLRLVEEALGRLRAGDYGTCLGCEQPIAPKRLTALPWARYCLQCQEEIGQNPEREMLDDRPRGFNPLHP